MIHVTLNVSNNISTVAVSLNIEKAFDTTWHFGLLYKLWKSQFSIRLIKLIISLHSQRKFRVSDEGEKATLQAGVPQGSVLSPTFPIAAASFPKNHFSVIRPFSTRSSMRNFQKVSLQNSDGSLASPGLDQHMHV
jgi:hypothetical protein